MCSKDPALGALVLTCTALVVRRQGSNPNLAAFQLRKLLENGSNRWSEGKTAEV